jgi:glycosyltransferase involved in cell wall biosynthesis
MNDYKTRNIVELSSVNPEINFHSANNPHDVLVPNELPLVSILLCILDGKQFLYEQLESISAQTHKNWRLYVSDDGDCHESLEILDNFKQRLGDDRLIILSGPRRGFALNFISLACNESIKSDYYAFCDQDDIWNSDKLERSIMFLSPIKNSIPSLYCSRTTIVDENNKIIIIRS